MNTAYVDLEKGEAICPKCGQRRAIWSLPSICACGYRLLRLDRIRLVPMALSFVPRYAYHAQVMEFDGPLGRGEPLFECDHDHDSVELAVACAQAHIDSKAST